ncbi:hypothetical protein CPB85DRAFT_1560987 [Mucidula mucida]|nr:hypothetical protein CPB85DRAFT_1560987 [Mucidula mucida]
MSSHSLQSLSGCEFPLLQEMGVRDQNPGGDGLDVPVDTFENVQNVRILRIYPYDTDIEGYQTLGKFPWSRLSKLSCYSFKLDSKFLPCLEQLTRIEELTIKTDFITEALLDDLSGRSITLPAVERIEVITSEPEEDDLQKFFQIVRIPSVSYFAVTFATYGPLYYTTLVPHPDFHRITSLHVTCSMTEPSM